MRIAHAASLGFCLNCIVHCTQGVERENERPAVAKKRRAAGLGV